MFCLFSLWLPVYHAKIFLKFSTDVGVTPRGPDTFTTSFEWELSSKKENWSKLPQRLNKYLDNVQNSAPNKY